MTNIELDYLLDKVDVFIENEIKLNKGVKNERICNQKHSRKLNSHSNGKKQMASNAKGNSLF